MARGQPSGARRQRAVAVPAPGFVRPMLATPVDPSAIPTRSDRLVYERKYDGIRAIAAVAPGAADPAGPGAAVTIWSRTGADKTAQFPDVAAALAALGRATGQVLLLDGEIVALDEHGRPAGFARLQRRLHLAGPRRVAEAARAQPVAFVAFDLLREDRDDLQGRPWTARRARLERLFRTWRRQAPPRGAAPLHLSEAVAGDARRLVATAAREGWEGLIVKDLASPYEAGRRSSSWRKLKVHRRDEFVVGGFTEGRGARAALGALLVGVWEATPGGRRLRFAGGVGTGFDRRTLAHLIARLRRLETPRCPFSGPVTAAGRVHWVEPSIVIEVQYAEWTPDGRLRHPVYLGWRDDKTPADVVARAVESPAVTAPADAASEEPARWAALLDRLHALEDARRNGWIELPGGRLYVSNLWKPFWPALGLTKGDLLRYYVAVSPFILPALADRPLLLKRFPDGAGGPAFYQQRVLQPPPAGVRAETLPDGADPIRDAGGAEPPRRFIGGSLVTLLYTVQLGAISQDPWFSTVRTPLEPDQAALDLDPGPEASWQAVLDVARWVRDELARLEVPAVPKTSGARGLHIYVPLPLGTSYESARLLCELVATLVAAKHPRHATVERVVARRPPAAVYIDYLQNLPGKTLAAAYSARASAYAGVSTPLAWHELDEGADPHAFTVRTSLARFQQIGDLWATLRAGPPVDLQAVVARGLESG